MHLFKQFFICLRKNTGGLILYIVIFAVMMAMMAFFTSDTGDDFETSKYSICYTDADNSDLSRGLVEYLSRENTVTDVSDKENYEISDMLFFRIYDFSFEIDGSFEDRVNEIAEARAAGESTEEEAADTLLSYSSSLSQGINTYIINADINSYLNTYLSYREMGFSSSEAADRAQEALSENTEISIESTSSENTDGGAGDAKRENVLIYSNQYFLFLLFEMVMMSVGFVIIKSNEVNIAKRIEVGPIPPYFRRLMNIAGLVVCGTIICAVWTAVFTMIGWGTDCLRDYWWLFIGNSFAGMLSVCAMVALITSFNLSANSLSMVANILGLSMAFMSGMFVPQWLLGDNVLKFSRFLSFYWYVRANNIAADGGDASKAWIYMAIQLIFAAAFSICALLIHRLRLSRKA